MEMWKDFTDFELASLAGQYGLEDSLVFGSDMTLLNRHQIEDMLIQSEFDMAFGE